MNKFFIIAMFSFLLVGCSTTVPVTNNWPSVPAGLLDQCPDLEKITIENPQLSDVLTTVTRNYSKYHECQIRVDLWIKWYNTQKEIFENVNK